MERRTLLILGAAAVASVGAALVLTPDSLREREATAGTLAFEGLAAKLREAGVPTTAVRFAGIIHDFVMLDVLRDTHAANAAIDLAIRTLMSALH